MSGFRRTTRGAAVLALLLSAGAARAGGWDASATTLFDSRPYARDGKAYSEGQLFETFSLVTPSAKVSAFDDVRVVLRAWGRAGLGDALVQSNCLTLGGHCIAMAGDVDVAFVEATAANRAVAIRIGRQMMTDGAARGLQVDGGKVTLRNEKGFGVEVYGGVPVLPRFAAAVGDAVAGGKVFWRPSFDSEISASFIWAMQYGDLARKDFALDAWFRPFKNFTLAGTLQWSLIEQRVAEGKVLGTWQIAPEMQLTADYTLQAPDLFIPRSSIFSVFSDERRSELGGEVALRLHKRVTAYVEVHYQHLAIGNGYHTGGKLVWRVPGTTGTSIGSEVRIQNEPENGYQQVRLYVMHKLPFGLMTTGEVDAVWLEKAINGHAKSGMATLTAGYQFSPALDLMAGGSFGITPYLERRWEWVARLTYHFGAEGRRP